jgi:hypothetical protein
MGTYDIDSYQCGEVTAEVPEPPDDAWLEIEVAGSEEPRVFHRNDARAPGSGDASRRPRRWHEIGYGWHDWPTALARGAGDALMIRS